MLGEPTRDRRAERHAATRAEILEAAWALAAENGLAGLSLRDIARRVGMQAPSLYSYFASKNDIYDAMFGQAWADALAEVRAINSALPDDARTALKLAHHAFFDFVVKDPARYLLMGQRTIPGFEPSAQAYQPAVETIDETRALLARFGVSDPSAIDIYVAINAGLVAQQTANEPGGTRWKALIDPMVEMFCDALGLPPARPAKKSAGKQRASTKTARGRR